MGIFSGDGMPAWRRWHQLICDRFGAGSPDAGDVIQPLAIAAPALFDNSSAALGRYLQTMYADRIPQWLPLPEGPFKDNLYIPSGASLAKGYRLFLYSLTSTMVQTATPEQRLAITQAADETEQARARLETFDNNTNSFWLLWKANHPDAKRDVWERDNSIPEKRRAMKLDRDMTLANYLRTVADAGQGEATMIAEQLVAMDDPTQKRRLPNTPERAKDDPETWDYYYIEEFSSDFAAFKNSPGVAETLTVNETTTESHYLETRWNAGGSVSFFGLFRAGGLSAEGKDIEEHIKNEATEISASFSGIEEFVIGRGAWYDEQPIRRYLEKVSTENFWGPNGALNLIPRSVIIVKGLTITINCSSSTLDRLEHHLSGSADAGFWWGWFRVGVGAGAGRDEVTIHRTAGSSTMTLRVKDPNACYVLAIRSWRPIDMMGKPKFFALDRTAAAVFERQEVEVTQFLAETASRVLRRSMAPAFANVDEESPSKIDS